MWVCGCGCAQRRGLSAVHPVSTFDIHSTACARVSKILCCLARDRVCVTFLLEFEYTVKSTVDGTTDARATTVGYG